MLQQTLASNFAPASAESEAPFAGGAVGLRQPAPKQAAPVPANEAAAAFLNSVGSRFASAGDH